MIQEKVSCIGVDISKRTLDVAVFNGEVNRIDNHIQISNDESDFRLQKWFINQKIDNQLRICMTDATCYESHLRFPTDVKLLWEGIVWLHRHLCKHCRTLYIQRSRNKYLDVSRAYLAYSKLRKRRKSQTCMITRRLLPLLEKLLDQLEQFHSSYRNRLTLSSDYQRRFSVIQTVLEQGKNLFAGKKVSNRIVSIDRYYLRPIVRARKTSPLNSEPKSIIYR